MSGLEISSIKKGQDITREALKNFDADLVVWSENSFRYPYTEGSRLYMRLPEGDPFIRFLSETGSPLLVGSPVILDIEKEEVLNAAVLISSNGTIMGYYGKHQLVPFAEHIPFWNIRAVRSFFENIVGLNSAGWTPGEKNVILHLPLKSGGTVKFGAPVCFEDVFPALCRGFFKSGADLLINITNDSWSKTVSGETQHFVAARYRAVEHKRYLIRSTNAGVTSVIGPGGRTEAALPLYEEGFLLAEIGIPENQKVTAYMILGDFLPFMLAAVILKILLSEKNSVGIFCSKS